MAGRRGCAIRVCWSRRSIVHKRDTTPIRWRKAAALWESLAQNPFVDGNKRTAFAAAYTFLAINGARLTATPGDAYAFVSGLYGEDDFSFKRLTPWLHENIRFDAGRP